MSQATMTLATEAPAATLPGTLGALRAPRSLGRMPGGNFGATSWQ